MAGTERGSVLGYAVDAGFPLSHKPDVFAWLITFDAQANARAGCFALLSSRRRVGRTFTRLVVGVE